MKLYDLGLSLFIFIIVWGGTVMYMDSRAQKKVDRLQKKCCAEVVEDTGCRVL